MYAIDKSSTIQLNYVAFIRNKIRYNLFWIRSSSCAIIQNNTLVGNSASQAAYNIEKSSTVQLNHVEFTQNKLKIWSLLRVSNSKAIIQNSTLIENNLHRYCMI